MRTLEGSPTLLAYERELAWAPVAATG
jgi:hypothetical protein